MSNQIKWIPVVTQVCEADSGSTICECTTTQQAKFICRAVEALSVLELVHNEMGNRISPASFDEFSNGLKTKIETVLLKR